MIQRELRFNINFEYIKEIRKYIYDIEEFLKINNLCDTINSVPPLPDDFEPQIERLSTIKIEDDKTINIFVSQASISISFIYTSSSNAKDCFKKDVKQISDISQSMKKLLQEKYPLFKINFEGLILASSKTILKDDDILVPKVSLKGNIEEDREKIVTELDSKHFKNVEKSFVKFYKDIISNINTMAIKNSKENFIGWNYILIAEISNRLEYHNSRDDDLKNLELNLDFATEEINRIVTDEGI